MVNTINRLGRCRLCFSGNISEIFEKYSYEITKCRNCGFIFLNFSPTEKFIKDYYSEDFFNDPGIKHGFNDYEREIKSLGKTFSERIDVIKKYKGHGTLLDIGCATGAFLEAATNSFRTYGLEISDYAGAVARKRGLEVFTGKLENSPYLQRRFDVITLWDTIEHLNGPNQIMESLSRMTNPESILAITTGDVGSLFSKLSGRFWHLYNIPQHLSFFDRASITRLLEKHQFRVKQITYPSLHFSLNYLLFRLLTFYKINKLIPFYEFLRKRQWLNLDLTINLFDIMFVIAEKK